MKKNIVKIMLKAAATVAMVAAMFVGGNKMEAKAMTIEEFAAWGGLTVEQVKADAELYSFYQDIKSDDISLWMDDGSASVAAATPVATATVTTTAGVPVSHPEMLALVNADRAANGAGNLTWNADLEVYLQTRVIEVMGNYQSPEMANAIATGSPTNVIAHKGSPEDIRENALWVSDSYSETAEVANADWIGSAGHHKARIKAGYTQYACASYIDPATGEMVWVELFK